MRTRDSEDRLLTSVALQNATSILLARDRAEDELRAAKEALHESQERLTAALAAAGTGTFRWNVQTNTIEWDRMLDQLFGLEPALTQSLGAFVGAVHVEDRAGLMSGWGRCARDGSDLDSEFRVTWADGSIHWIHDKAKAFFDAHGTPHYITGACTDITTRKEAEGERLVLAERLSLAAAIAKVGVWEWDLTSNMLTWDATMFGIYGLAPAPLIPYSRWAEAVHPDDRPRIEGLLQTAITDKRRETSQYRIVRPDGVVRHVSSVERAVPGHGGNVVRMIGVNMDVTERTLADEALEQSRQDQMRFKDEFLSNISHELRSPLTAIKQFATILFGGLAPGFSAEQREYQQILLKNIRQLHSMIDELLEVTRLESGKLTVDPEPLVLSDLVSDVLNTFQVAARARHVTLSAEVPADLPPAHADPSRTRQILIILLDNAIKFTSAGGAVRIKVRRLPDAPLLLVEVSDTGCGISPEATKRIFERLYQVPEATGGSRKGLGLGLYLCHAFVTRQGGRIWLESVPQKGSTFSFTLPVSSLESTLAPLLQNHQWPTESVALIRVEVCFPSPPPSKESQEEWAHEARSLLRHCLLPTLDVLLPKMTSDGDRVRFSVAAFADDRGAASLTERIRHEFARLPYLRQTVAVSYNLLHHFPHDGESPTEMVTTMAIDIEASLKTDVPTKPSHHEE